MEKTPQERLRKFINSQYPTQKAFAEDVGWNETTITAYIKKGGRTATHKKTLEKLEKAGLNTEWYLHGKGEMLLKDQQKARINETHLLLEIKVYEAPAYANVGTLTSIEDLSYNVKEVAIKDKYLDPEKIAGLKVKGRSMVGAGIFPNDLLIFSKEIPMQNNSIVVININGCIMVKYYNEKKIFSVPEFDKYEEIPEYHDDNGHYIGTVIKIEREDINARL